MNQGSSDLSRTLEAQINDAYAAFCGFDDQIRRAVVGKANKARDLGLLLQTYRKDYVRGTWRLLFKREGKPVTSYTFAFSYETACLLIRFSEAYPDPIIGIDDAIQSFKQLMIVSGVLAAPCGHGEQQRGTLTWLDRFALAAGKAREFFNGQIEKLGGDVRALPDSQRESLKLQLRPLVDVYERLG